MHIWYQDEAKEWEEALPVGNGRIGAMVWGGAQEERLSLNEDTLWSGDVKDKLRYGAADHLNEIRSLIFDGKNMKLNSCYKNITLVSGQNRIFQ